MRASGRPGLPSRVARLEDDVDDGAARIGVVLDQRLGVMDQTAIVLCQRRGLGETGLCRHAVNQVRSTGTGVMFYGQMIEVHAPDLVLSGHGEAVDAPRWIGLSAAALAFLLVGAGMHIVQTVGLALATDQFFLEQGLNEVAGLDIHTLGRFVQK